MSAKQDYYEVLEVSRSASSSEIKAAYRKKALQYHPDRNPGDTEAEEMFKFCSEAYEVLSDDNKKQIYDQFGHAGLQNGGMGGGGFHNAEDIFSAFGDIFEDFFGFGSSRSGRSGRGRKRARRGRDLQVEVEVEFLDACFGIEKEVEVSSHVKCETCDGSGAKKGTEPETCRTCGGHGQVQMSQGFFTISTNCPDCHGQGQMIKEKCSDCRGHGVIVKPRKLKVKVPPGIEDGMRLVMRSQGEDGENGGPAGDLYVLVHIEEHPEFKRDGNDILSHVEVPFPYLAIGTEIEVNTIDGPEHVKIKAGTHSGDVISLRSKGVADVRTGRRGEQHIYIQASTPKKLSKKQKELMEELAREFPLKSMKQDSSKASKNSKKKSKKKSFFSL